MSTRILSGIQTSGALHLGNYFGAIKQFIELQDNPDNEVFYFLADFHAMTTVHDPAQLRQFIIDAAIDYLALGLDPKKATLFRQSDVPEVTELAWMLSCVTGLGLMERGHSYKDKIAKGIKPNLGLLTYPILMAADILIYKAKWVPVGKDQIQHIEMTQDIAQYFNNTYQCDCLVRPEAKLSASIKVPGIDGSKMSKSYGNTINLNLTGKSLKKIVMKIVTDSKELADPKDPDSCNVFALYSLFATEQQQAELAERYRAGGLGYGDAKKQLLEQIEAYFAPYHQRRAELENNLDYVNQVLTEGAAQARACAQKTLTECKQAAGLL